MATPSPWIERSAADKQWLGTHSRIDAEQSAEHRAADGCQRRADDEGGDTGARRVDAHEQRALPILLDRSHRLAVPKIVRGRARAPEAPRWQRRNVTLTTCIAADLHPPELAASVHPC